MAKVDRTEETYFWWRKKYAGFAENVDRARAKRRGEYERPDATDFGSFREEYLRMKTHWHQWQWVDILEGREPRDLHPTQTYLKGRSTRLLVNTPPHHAKTMTLSIDYVVYRICQDPSVRVLIVSESRDMAQKILGAIRDRLSHPQYEKLQQAYGPFRDPEQSWNNNRIYVKGRDPEEKDPTVECLGVGSQIYGARADLIILDDTITLKTCTTEGKRDKILQWIRQEVMSRLEPRTGQLLIAGTRVSSRDAYWMLLDGDKDKPEERRTWTYLAQPAVLEYGDHPRDWVTLWPAKDNGEPQWDGEEMARVRDEVSDLGTWDLVYMQRQVSSDAVFPQEAVGRCLYLGNAGPLPGSVRRGGMEGLYVVAGLDPAASGFTAIVVLAIDKATGVRYVLDVINHRNCTPARLREYVADLTAKYRPNEWRIENNAIQSMIAQDPEIRHIVQQYGGRVVEHHTGGNKWDAEFGVASLAPLFTSALETPPRALIQIPNNHTHKGVLALVDQLVAWDPDTKGRTDTVMALWFADLGCRQMLKKGSGQTHLKNRWVTRGGEEKRFIVRFDEMVGAR